MSSDIEHTRVANRVILKQMMTETTNLMMLCEHVSDNAMPEIHEILRKLSRKIRLALDVNTEDWM